MRIGNLLGKTAIALCALGLFSTVQAQVNEHTFRISIAGAPGHPSVMGAEKWAELVKQKSGGKMTIKVFPNGLLGGDVQVLSAVQGGTIDFTSMNSGILQSQVKEFAIFDFPFMFENGKEADPILDGAFGKKLADLLPAKNLVNLAYWELGFRNLTNSKRPIAKADDIAGLKIRVIQSPIYIETFNALGANAIPMPITEVYTAMEQKIIDGHENPFSVIETSKFNEVQKFLTVSNHIYNPQSVLASKKKWDALTKDEQDVLMAAMQEATKWQRENARTLADQSLTNLKKSMQVSVLPPEETAKIRAKIKPVIDKFAANVGPELVQQLQSELEKGRKK
ncbi:TRAP transporter substrate-binding protein [uncultured Propionivibrio sp.]|uniref:TRAP transporter substrate-binding protein n=1 Tax=uncultured Propionivibrio sp. TaxID=426737 RepID=UPI0029C00813|nr:TRAP transporter substrate-binding protein [uncultured Propionivibrio sp.]